MLSNNIHNCQKKISDLIAQNMNFHLIFTEQGIWCILEPCVRQVNLYGLWVPAFAGRVREPILLCVRVWVKLAAGWERIVLGAGGRGL